MAFILNKRPSYSWPVTFLFPSANGQYEKSTFDVEFKHLKQSEIKKMLNDPKGNDIDFCKAIVVGWKGICSEPDQELPFTQENLERVLEQANFAKTVASAFLESLDGAKAKN